VNPRERVEALIKQLEARTLTAADAVLSLGGLGPEGKSVLAALHRMGFPKLPATWGSSSGGSKSFHASTANF
jgi:hypothetical protein